MHLLEIAQLAPLAAREARGQLRRGRARGQPPEERLGRIDKARVIDRACGRKDHAPRRIVPLHEAAEIGRLEPRDILGRPKDRAPHRLVGKGRFLQPVEDDVVGGVERLPDLLQDDMPLGLDLGRVEGGVEDDVGDDVEREV
jgi:hypothetical protein